MKLKTTFIPESKYYVAVLFKEINSLIKIIVTKLVPMRLLINHLNINMHNFLNTFNAVVKLLIYKYNIYIPMSS